MISLMALLPLSCVSSTQPWLPMTPMAVRSAPGMATGLSPIPVMIFLMFSTSFAEQRGSAR